MTLDRRLAISGVPMGWWGTLSLPAEHRYNFYSVSFAFMRVLVLWGASRDWRCRRWDDASPLAATVQTAMADTSDWLGDFILIVSYHLMKVMEITSNCLAIRAVRDPVG